MTVDVASGVTTRKWKPIWYEHWSEGPTAKPRVIVVPPYVPPVRLLEYGSAANDSGNPIGGGATYSDIKTTGDYAPVNKVQFLANLAAASSGEVIYVAEAVSIDLSGESDLVVPEGVIIASNRGQAGSVGGLLYTTDMTFHWGRLFIPKSHVRFTGLRLRGPDSTIGANSADPTVTGIECDGYHGLIVDNNELYNWPYAAVQVSNDSLSGLSSADRAYIHHNNIHHNRREGNGYGVGIQAASALVEANLFDYCRHYIMCDRSLSGQPTANYEFRFNTCGPNIFNTLVDAHGGNDSVAWGNPYGPDASIAAGGTLLIHHNDFQTANQYSVGVRGIPAVNCEVYRNWTYWTSKAAFHQYLENLGMSPYQKMMEHDNWYGLSTPPS